MKVKQTPTSKKAKTTRNTESPSSILAADLAQKEQIIQRLEKELLACQEYKENLKQTLLDYQQQPIPTLLSFYQNKWQHYYLNQIVLPLNQHYEHLLSTSLRLIADSQNLLQAKIQVAHEFVFQLNQQGLVFIEHALHLQQQLLHQLKTTQAQLSQISLAKIAELQNALLHAIHAVQQRLATLFPKLGSHSFTASQANSG